jgi:RNA polymerase sigma-70 factor (ECF subfamily)
VELFAFTREYVERLRQGDPSTEQHFVTYFGQLLRIKLRSKMLAAETVDDLCQDTYIRVLKKVREDGIQHPECFGAFVNSICNNVLMEFYRERKRDTKSEEPNLEMPDHAKDQEALMVTVQTKRLVRQILAMLPPKDCQLLRSYFLEEKDKDEVCVEFGVDRDYFRVLLHRAQNKFRVLYEKDRQALSGRPPKAKANETI